MLALKENNPSLKTSLSLYDAATIDDLPWPETYEGQYAKNFLTPFVKNGAHYYIDNIDTQFLALKVDNFVIPVTVNNEEYENSFVCSPYTLYITYALASLPMLQKGIVLKSTEVMLKTLGKILRKGQINKVVMVNNWLFTTNLYPPLTKEQIKSIVEYLKERFPDHAIGFRSINAGSYKTSYDSIIDSKLLMIASRQIYQTDTKDENNFTTRIYKSDLKQLRESSYEIVDAIELSDEDIHRVLDLYRALYIDKYSKNNPQFNLNFIKLAVDNGTLHLKTLKKNGTVEGAIGYSTQYNAMVSPFFGYDPSAEHKGLYRLLSTILMQEARSHQVLFNQSAGASFYKKIRRAKPYLEYMSVYVKHLPYSRRLPWNILSSIMNYLGAPFMKKY